MHGYYRLEDHASMQDFILRSIRGRTDISRGRYPKTDEDVLIEWMGKGCRDLVPEYRNLLIGHLGSKELRTLCGLLHIARELKDKEASDKVLEWAYPDNSLSPEFIDVHAKGDLYVISSGTRNKVMGRKVGEETVLLFDVTQPGIAEFYADLMNITPDMTVFRACAPALRRRSPDIYDATVKSNRSRLDRATKGYITKLASRQ